MNMNNGENSPYSEMPIKRKASAQDVAKLAGVSQSTVSRVLSGAKNHLISEKTRQKVIEIANQLEYTPHPIAQALRGKQSHLLGLIVRELDDPFFAKLVAECSRQAKSLGYNIVLGDAEGDPQKALEMKNVLDARHTDGVFILGDLPNEEAALQKMIQHSRAIIGLCRGTSPASICGVNTDNRKGTELLLDHLFNLGHRRLGFIGGDWRDIRERRETFLDYVRLHNLLCKPDWIQSGVNSPKSGYVAMRRILALPDRPTAIFASDDVVSIGVIKAISDVGMHIPQDISVAGFDNVEFTEYLTPALTTVRQPVEAICQQALQLMLTLIKNPATNLAQLVFRMEPELVIRNSTGPVPKE